MTRGYIALAKQELYQGLNVVTKTTKMQTLQKFVDAIAMDCRSLGFHRKQRKKGKNYYSYENHTTFAEAEALEYDKAHVKE